VQRRRPSPPKRLISFVDLETRLFEVLNHPLGELLAYRR
jgi:hypothetical protein